MQYFNKAVMTHDSFPGGTDHLHWHDSIDNKTTIQQFQNMKTCKKQLKTLCICICFDYYYC